MGVLCVCVCGGGGGVCVCVGGGGEAGVEKAAGQLVAVSWEREGRGGEGRVAWQGLRIKSRRESSLEAIATGLCPQDRHTGGISGPSPCRLHKCIVLPQPTAPPGSRLAEKVAFAFYMLAAVPATPAERAMRACTPPTCCRVPWKADEAASSARFRLAGVR